MFRKKNGYAEKKLIYENNREVLTASKESGIKNRQDKAG